MQTNEIKGNEKKYEEISGLLTEIKLIPAFQKIEKENLIDVLFSFYRTLTEEEKTILQILYNSTNPLSVRQIRKKYMIEKAKENEEMIEKVKIIEKKKEKFKLIENVVPLSSLEEILESLNDKETNELISAFNKNFPDKIPSYYKIKTCLEYFEKIGLVKRRELEGRKAESVWLLSPIFSKICLTVVSHIEEKKNKSNLTSVETNLYFLITGKNIYFIFG